MEPPPSYKAVMGLMLEKSNIHKDVYIPRLSLAWKVQEPTLIKFLCGGGFLTPDPLKGVNQRFSAGETIKIDRRPRPVFLDDQRHLCLN